MRFFVVLLVIVGAAMSVFYFVSDYRSEMLKGAAVSDARDVVPAAPGAEASSTDDGAKPEAPAVSDAKTTMLPGAQEQVAASARHVAQLEAQVARLNDETRQNRLRLASALNEKQDLADRAGDERVKAGAAQSEQLSKVEAIARERDDLKSRLTLADSKQAGTLSEARQLRDALASAREQIASRDRDLEPLRAKSASLGSKTTVLRSILVVSLKQARELREAAEAEATKTATLDLRVADGDKARSQLQAALDAAIEASAQRQNRIDALSKAMQAGAQREGDERIRTGAALDEMRLKLTQLQAQNAEVAAVTDQLASTTRKARLLETAIKVGNEKREALERTLTVVSSQNAEREKKIAELTKTVERAAQHPASPEAAAVAGDRPQDTIQRVTVLEGTIKGLEAQRKELTDRLAAVTDDGKEKQARIETLTKAALADADSQRSERGRLSAALEESRSKLEALRADNDRLVVGTRSREASAKAAYEAQLGTANAKLGEAVRAEQAMEVRASALASRADALRRDVEGKAAIVAALRSDLASAAAEKAANGDAAQAKLDDVTKRLATERATAATLGANLANAEQRLAALPMLSSAPLKPTAAPPADVPTTTAKLDKQPPSGDPVEGRSILSPSIPLGVERARSVRAALSISSSADASPKVQSTIARAGKLLEQGDISGARLLLEWLTKDGSGQATLLLGDTYNPAFLAKLHVIGVRGDSGYANDLYRTAAKAGVSGAEQRLRP